MKKIIITSILFALILSSPAIAEITVLSGNESVKAYALEEDLWYKYREDRNIFLIIDAELGTPHFTVNEAVVIFYWKEWEGEQKFKYYEDIDLIGDLGADIQIADLGIINEKKKVAFCLKASFIDNDNDVASLGHLIGERNRKGKIKYLKGHFFVHSYNLVSSEITEIEKTTWVIERTKDFTGETVSDLVDAIVTYLESRNYQPEP